MKKIFIFLLAGVICAGFAACDDDDDEGGSYSSSDIVGTWVVTYSYLEDLASGESEESYDQDEKFAFRSDGTVYLYEKDDSSWELLGLCQWKILGSSLMLYNRDVYLTFKIKNLTSTALTIEMSLEGYYYLADFRKIQ